MKATVTSVSPEATTHTNTPPNAPAPGDQLPLFEDTVNRPTGPNTNPATTEPAAGSSGHEARNGRPEMRHTPGANGGPGRLEVRSGPAVSISELRDAEARAMLSPADLQHLQDAMNKKAGGYALSHRVTDRGELHCTRALALRAPSSNGSRLMVTTFSCPLDEIVQQDGAWEMWNSFISGAVQYKSPEFWKLVDEIKEKRSDAAGLEKPGFYLAVSTTGFSALKSAGFEYLPTPYQLLDRPAKDPQAFKIGPYATSKEAAFGVNVVLLYFGWADAELDEVMHLTVEHKKEIEKEVLQRIRLHLQLPNEFEFPAFPQLYTDDFYQLPPIGEREQIEVFDFEKNWHLIRPHLEAAIPALTSGINKVFEFRGEQAMKYDPAKGPWTYSTTDYWQMELQERAEEAINRGDVELDLPGEEDDEETVQRKFDEYFAIGAPTSDTHEWYQLHGGITWLIPWQLVLGRLVFPHLVWQPVASLDYSFAAGFENGKMRVIFDIFEFKKMTAPELIALVEKGGSPRLGEEGVYEFQPTEMLRTAEIPSLN